MLSLSLFWTEDHVELRGLMFHGPLRPKERGQNIVAVIDEKSFYVARATTSSQFGIFKDLNLDHETIDHSQKKTKLKLPIHNNNLFLKFSQKKKKNRSSSNSCGQVGQAKSNQKNAITTLNNQGILELVWWGKGKEMETKGGVLGPQI